ncbi:hypothetical protein D9M71_180840 [compost metagenome]
MDRQALATVPGVLHDAGMGDVGHLLNHIQLTQTVDPLFLGRQLAQFNALFVVQVANRAQPAVDQAELAILHRRPYAAAAIVAGHQDVFDLEHVDGVLDHRQAVQVGVQYHVGHVAVNEQVAGQHTHDFIGRYARIGTADPEEFGRLLASKLGEEVWIFLLDRIGPALVVINQFL